MRLKSAVLALSLSLAVLAPRITLADSLTLTGVGGANTDGVYTYPYIFTVTVGNNTTTGVDLSCLNFNREITFNESWDINAANLSSIASNATVDGSSDTALREDAYLDSLYDTGFDGASDSEIQFAIWDVLDPSDMATKDGFDAISQLLVIDAQNAQAGETNGFLSQFTLFTPVVPAGAAPANWNGNGEPQEFLQYTPSQTNSAPPAATPEPSSLMLMGTGLLGGVLILRRKLHMTPQPIKK